MGATVRSFVADLYDLLVVQMADSFHSSEPCTVLGYQRNQGNHVIVDGDFKFVEYSWGNPDLAGEFLCNKQANTSTSSVHTSAGEARGKESSKSSNGNISENSFYGNGKSRASNTKWHLVSGRTVSSFLGKDYVKPAQPANGTFLASKPLKLDPKEFPMSALCREESKPKQSKDDHLQKDMEDFLFKFPGDGFQLNRDVIQEVLDSCGYDMQKVRTISS
ncbi:hypothetical protein KPL71_020933 [Citrus sinensis]|uniref:Uncharacterized protein n=1 Tax=Citrus sinensis TaxID=2711 RepID=A0ACB8JC95_CITSI|nr:hypothetical protein KPL71_020933 [Citrus sinensis]